MSSFNSWPEIWRWSKRPKGLHSFYFLLIFSQSPFIKIIDVQTSLLVNTQYFLYCVVFFFYKKNPTNNVVGSFTREKNGTESDKNPIYLQKEIFFSPSSLYLWR